MRDQPKDLQTYGNIDVRTDRFSYRDARILLRTLSAICNSLFPSVATVDVVAIFIIGVVIIFVVVFVFVIVSDSGMELPVARLGV